MAIFEVQLKPEVTSGGLFLSFEGKRALPPVLLREGESWEDALGRFVAQTFGPVKYKASLLKVCTVKNQLEIYISCALDNRSTARDSRYAWAGSDSGPAISAPEQPPPSLDVMREVVLCTDGASRGNPGPAGIGIVLSQQCSGFEEELSRFIGRATNNVAEYTALVEGVDLALERGARSVRHITDSELIVRQLQGLYRVKSPELKPLFDRARSLIARLEYFRTGHVPRDQNKQADSLAAMAIDAALADMPAAEQDSKPEQAPPEGLI